MSELENAAAPAPAPAPDVVSEAPEQAPELNEDDALSAVFDALNASPDSKPAEAPTEDADAPEQEAAPDPAPEPVELPPHMPASLKATWGSVPEDARTQFAAEYKRIADEKAETGRRVAHLQPMQDALVQSIKANPDIKDLPPQQVLNEIPKLVQAGVALRKDPVNALLQLAHEHGVVDQFAKMAQGIKPTENDDAMRKLQAENAKLRQMVSPETLREQVRAINEEERTVADIAAFQKTAEHWATVEPHLPHAIAMAKAKLGDGASPADTLKLAYELAVQTFLPDVAPKPEASPADAPAPDPAKAQEALKAKSVNVEGKSTGRKKPLTEDERLAAIYDARHAS